MSNKRIIISIKPKYSHKILDGTKKYEYRRIIAKENIDSLIIYESAPTSRIVAEVKAKGILKMTPKDLWEKTKDYSGTTKEFFDDYFKNRDIACAYELGEIRVFPHPHKLSDFGLNFAPQSFVYYN